MYLSISKTAYDAFYYKKFPLNFQFFKKCYNKTRFNILFFGRFHQGSVIKLKMVHSVILKYFIIWKPLGYIVAFFGMMLEGEGFLFALSFLTHRGFFNAVYMFFILLAGALIGDLFWYWFGRRFNTSHIPFAFLRNWIDKIAKPLDDHLINRTKHTVFISKFVYGFHRLIMIRSGSLKIKLIDIIKIDIVATIVWIFVIGGLGYLSSLSLHFTRRRLRLTEIALAISIIVFILFWDFIVRKLLKKKL